jgi:glutamine amidotransferase
MSAATRVTVVDYGLGNLHSVIKALVYLGAEVSVAEDGAQLASAERVVLPGVGAFPDGMAGLQRRGHIEALRSYAASGRPLAGICLGAQVMLDGSDEFGSHHGLGLIPGRVVRIPSEGVKVPHVGWNRILPYASWDRTPLRGTSPGTWAYFVHSYHMMPTTSAHLLAVAKHGSHDITAVIGHGAIIGFQFHPEKSGQPGLAMLTAFLKDT